MSEMPDSESVARPYCPGCEDANPLTEILEIRYCEPHAPTREGALDHVVSAYGYLSGNAEAGGEENAAFCDWLHRKRTLLRGPA